MLNLLALTLLAPTTVFTHATLIDGNGGPPLVDATVAISAGRISYAGPGSVYDPQPDAKIVDCKGKWIIPGLFDMHTHVDDPELVEVDPKPEEKAQWLPLFVLMGVTGIREMAGQLDLIKGFKEQIAGGKLLGPRIWHGGPLVDGRQPMWPESIAVSNVDQARQTVRDLKAKGADFVKAYSLLARESFFALCDEAKKQGIPICGHVPVGVTNAEACDAGLNSIEHLLQLDRELADPDKVAEMRKALTTTDRFARFKAYAEINEKCFDPARAAALFAKFKEKGVWIDPTLVVAYQNATFDPADPEMARRRQYVPAYVRQWWDPEKNVHLKDQTPELRAGQQTVFRIYRKVVAEMKKAGVPMMTGSDMGGNPHCFAGWGVHDEMGFLVDCGLTPLEALTAATSNPAKYLGVFGERGSLEAGKSADLVVLDADPLLDIKNTQRIDTVVNGGEMLDRAALASLWAKQLEATKKRL